MENNSQVELDRWVEDHLGALLPPTGWQPDTAAGLEQFRRGRRARAAWRKAAAWTAVTLAAVAGCALAFPATRVFARRCVDACLSEIPLAQNLVPANERAPAGIVPAADRQPAPDLLLSESGGDSGRLSDLRGRVVLLNFWATWCGPCKVEIPWWVELQPKYRDAGLTILGVAFDDDGWNSVTPYMARKGVNYRVALGNDQVAAQFGGVQVLPTTFLIDRSGRIAATFQGLTGKDVYERDVEHLLAEK